MRLFFRSRWTVIAISLITAAILISSGYVMYAGVVVLLVYALITAQRSHLEENPLGKAFIMGVVTGLAGLFWIWALTAFVPMLIILLWPLRSRTFKVFMSALLGLATPWWIYMPYYLYITFHNFAA